VKVPYNFSWLGWQANHPYALGDQIQPPKSRNAGLYLFQVVTAGTSNPNALLEPIWSAYQNIGSTVVLDGGVTWQNIGPANTGPGTAIFDPGVYYLGSNGLQLKGGTVRPSASTVTGDGTKGAMFYFTGGGTVSVDSNSGKASACTSVTVGSSSISSSPNNCIVSYTVDGSALLGVTTQPLRCPNGVSNPTAVPSTLDGNILLGPCTGTYGDPEQKYRGFLFFQDRGTAVNPGWGGGGQFLLAGLLYLHKTGASGGTCGASTPTVTCLTMQGNSGAGAFTIGTIVADEIQLGGSSGIKMILAKTGSYSIIRAQLLN
jgi:hypothetical protein